MTEDDRQWYFTVKLMADRDEVKELCVSDVAMNGGTYKARSRVTVKLGPDGLFHAVATPPEGNSC